MQRAGDPVLNGFAISPVISVACPFGAADSFAFYYSLLVTD